MRLRARVAVLAAAVVALLGLLAYSVAEEPAELRVTRVDIAPRRWPQALDGLRVVALSDIHAGAPHVDLAKLREVVATANAQQPDLALLLGDYVINNVVGGRFLPPETTARELAALRARLGVYAVLGNHDHWLDGPRVAKAFVDAGIPVLDDKAVALSDRGRRFWLLGIRDIWVAWPNLPRLFAKVPAGEPTLVLTHNPDIFPFLPDGVDVMFAGHTHGGQVRLPLLGPPIVPSQFGQRYARGHVREDGRDAFVTSGVGTSILPLRLGVPPEVAVIELRGAAPHPPDPPAASPK